MAIEIKAPVVGESITEITIAKWLKSDGDYIEMDEIICEMESEKATFELNAETSGILTIIAKEGDTVQIGDVVCVIEESDKGKEEKHSEQGSKENKTKDKKAESPQKTGEVVEMKVPTVGESITEVTISAWIKNDGEFVELDEVIAEIESEKATFELTAEGRGILHQKVKEGTTLEIGGLICTIEVVAGMPAKSDAVDVEIVKPRKDESKDQPYSKSHPSPAAAKILAEKGIKPDQITGSGPGGRILKEDALKAALSETEDKLPVSKSEEATAASPAYGLPRNETRQKLSQLRKTVSRRLVAVKNETAMLTTFNEVNMAAIMDLRKKYKEPFKEKYDVNLGFMSFFTKACCIALNEWPSVNAKIDGDEMIFHNYCDISIAVSAPKGLVVPVIRNAESLSFVEIEREVLELATKARDNKLSMEEMTGGTFTITNGGVFGSMMSTPIINAPQSAILGMHNIVERPVVENGEIMVRPMMYLALSYDHRIIDGRESVSFLVRLKQLLEDPSRLLLEI